MDQSAIDERQQRVDPREGEQVAVSQAWHLSSQPHTGLRISVIESIFHVEGGQGTTSLTLCACRELIRYVRALSRCLFPRTFGTEDSPHLSGNLAMVLQGTEPWAVSLAGALLVAAGSAPGEAAAEPDVPRRPDTSSFHFASTFQVQPNSIYIYLLSFVPKSRVCPL